MKTNRQLRVDNPCPFLLERMKKNDDGYYCRSCSKTIIDFRDKTTAEICSSTDENTCGIFYRYQLTGQQKMSAFRQAAFYCLVFLSFLGFNVKPVYGQNSHPATEQSPIQLAPEKDKEKKTKKKDKSSKGKSGKKKEQYKTIGTPAF